jgi:hypothetical protein
LNAAKCAGRNRVHAVKNGFLLVGTTGSKRL